MKSIIIDTTNNNLKIIAINGEKSIKFIGKDSFKRHNSVLLNDIEQILAKINMDVEDIKIIGIVVGPGSFTGIRVGVATANAIAKVTKAAIVPMTSLEIIAYQVIDEDRIAALDCKNENYYALHIENGEYHYYALTLNELLQYKCKKLFIDNSYADNIIKVFNKKVLRNLTVEKAEPFYIKRSSAENDK